MVAISKPEIAPAPNRNTYIIAALILVPIVIAVVATFVAIKTTDIFSSTKKWATGSPFTAWTRCLCRPRRLKHKNSSLTLHTTDSFFDLESVDSPSTLKLKKGGLEAQAQEAVTGRGAATKSWHPTRSARLTWSFGRNSKKVSKYQGPFELSNAQEPIQPQMVALSSTRERSSSLDDSHLVHSAQIPLAHSKGDR